MAYFETLNYTLANEDTAIEATLLQENAENVFSISGSGARVMPLIAKNPKSIDVIDVAQPQLYLCELRHAAARALTYDEYLFFLGYRGALPGGDIKGDSRLPLFDKLELSNECKEFWRPRAELWGPHGFILLGRWESHFQKLGAIFRRGLRMNVCPVFCAQSLEEQLEMYKKHFNATLFRNFLRLVANEYVFNKFLYKGHFSGSSERRTEKRVPWQFIDEEFSRLFTTTLVRKNYFLQILFLGRIEFEEGLPLEAHQTVFNKVKTSPTRVNYALGDLTELVRRKPFDFVSLSDTISYLKPEDANLILRKMHPETKKGAVTVIRSFLRAPGAIDTEGWAAESELNRWAYETDGTGVYQFHIFRKN